MKQFLKLKNLKTLLIDDNVIIRDTMQMLFAQKRCLLKTCETAEDGLQALEAKHFDIIICDYLLPGIDGVEFFKQAVPSHPDTINILISGFVNESAISEAFDIGVQAFIRKPFSLMVFFEQLIPLIEKHQNRDPQNCDTSETEEAPGNQYQTQATGKKNQWCLAF